MARPQISIHDAALTIVQRLRDAGHEALFAGGSVRDMLLKIDPVDIDVATSAHPEQIVQLFRRTRKVGMQFGVVLVKKGPHWIEVATFRTDVNYQDGRRPERVVFTTAEEDAQRRDFTINGLFYDPIDQRVIDYVGGQEDLKAGIVRAIGDPAQRFAEDHLRMLRAVRFATRFGFTIEPATAAAIREHAPELTRISAERIREELEKMLQRPTRAEAVRQIADLGLLPYLWPEARWTDQQLSRAIRVLADLPAQGDFVLCLAAFLLEYSTREARRIARELRCSNDEIAALGWLIQHIDSIQAVEILCLPEFKRLIAHPRFDDLLALHQAYCTAHRLPLDTNQAARERREKIPPAEVAPPPLVTGDDLIAMGLEPGPIFGEVLDVLYDEQLDNRLRTREAALERMRKIVMECGHGRPHTPQS
jgi:poly(A) polymerase